MKLKTCKAVSKRVTLTKRGKILKRKAGQDHFNAREPGKVTRNKRRLTTVSKANQKTIRKVLHIS